jgi:hypothetical protein
MAPVHQLNVYGAFGGFSGPLASGGSDHWQWTGGPADTVRPFWITAANEGGPAGVADIEVVHVQWEVAADAQATPRLLFEIHNHGPQASYYYFYGSWTDVID